MLKQEPIHYSNYSKYSEMTSARSDWHHKGFYENELRTQSSAHANSDVTEATTLNINLLITAENV